jgi:hypothetical protein
VQLVFALSRIAWFEPLVVFGVVAVRCKSIELGFVDAKLTLLPSPIQFCCVGLLPHPESSEYSTGVSLTIRLSENVTEA